MELRELLMRLWRYEVWDQEILGPKAMEFFWRCISKMENILTKILNELKKFKLSSYVFRQVVRLRFRWPL